MYKLVLIRHGESTWNLENRFTGWTDVALTPTGVAQAQQSGRLLKEGGYEFDVAYTSVLKRAIHTLNYALDEMDRAWLPVVKDWRLNERHYGGLQGLNKADMAKQYGDEQVLIWRRSYDTPPPALEKDDPRSPANDARYAGLFKSLNLTPAQLDKFKNLLVERQTSMMDVMAAARGQGLNREDMQKLVASTQAEIDASIKSAIGDTAFSQYKNYDQTAAQRATTDQLSQRLSYSGAPLTAEQSAAMTQILSQTVPTRAATATAGAAVTVVAEGGRGGFGGFGMNFIAASGAGMGGPSSPITDATITMAQGVLSAPQVEALKQLQAEQQAQQKIAEAMRQTMGGNNNRTPTTTTTTKKKGD